MCNEKLIPSNMNLRVVSALDTEQVNASRKKDVNGMAPKWRGTSPLKSKMLANLPRISLHQRKLKYECRLYEY